MSFLLEEEEKMATLEELFAFIDCLDGSAETVENGDPMCSAETSESPLILDEEKLTPVMQTDMNVHKMIPSRRRKRIGWSSSTGLQRRKRAELQFLRQHVVDMETYLQQLKAPTFASSTMATRWQWKELAATEFAERLRSEEVNRALKKIMNNQLEIHEALRGVLEEGILCTHDSQSIPMDDVQELKSEPPS
ncbi:hypothetical protein JG688_00017898 [Phytophthora aleatoria]|uniref:Uncharacterized protein n=1 Tax=Phytophthora aleatoria TaxID=2496075 RepID=A0A8J5IGQ6_9STRA|nr:hypothetical protein JG688_00017898 [Phytophthora aleatoria]